MKWDGFWSQGIFHSAELVFEIRTKQKLLGSLWFKTVLAEVRRRLFVCWQHATLFHVIVSPSCVMFCPFWDLMPRINNYLFISDIRRISALLFLYPGFWLVCNHVLKQSCTLPYRITWVKISHRPTVTVYKHQVYSMKPRVKCHSSGYQLEKSDWKGKILWIKKKTNSFSSSGRSTWIWCARLPKTDHV